MAKLTQKQKNYLLNNTALNDRGKFLLCRLVFETYYNQTERNKNELSQIINAIERILPITLNTLDSNNGNF